MQTSTIDRLRIFAPPVVFVLLVEHDTKHNTAMTVRMVAMSVFLRSNNNRRQVLVLVVANHCFRLMSTTQMVAVAQIRRAHDRK